MAQTLAISESRAGAVVVLAVSGRIDSTNAEQLLGRLKQALASGEKALVLDLRDVAYLTSAAFRALLVATDEAERSMARFVLCSVLGQVHELFEMGGLLEVFTIHASREEAVAQLS